MKYLLADLFEKPISGEWGNEVEEGKSGIKVIRTTNFTNLGRLNLSNIVYRDIDLQKNLNKRLRFGDIIIEKSGGSPTQPVGRPVVFEEDSSDIYFCNNFTSILRPNDKVNYKYSLYLLKALHNKGKVLKYQNKTTGIINIKLNDYINNTEVEVPPIDKQIKIAKVLDKAQELIDKRKEQLSELDELVKSRFIGMFNEYFSEEYIDELMNISDKITDGEHGTVPRVDTGVQYLMARNISINNTLDFKEVSYIEEKVHDKIYSRCNPECGDLLMVCVGATIGKVALVPKIQAFSMARSVALVKYNRDLVNGNYLLWLFNHNYMKSQLKNSSNESAQAGLYIGKIKKLKVPVPPIELQNQFADFANQVDKLKFEMEKSLKELEDNFKSLMQKAFKGELY
jgi:type I restriction enzyme, S subunit